MTRSDADGTKLHRLLLGTAEAHPDHPAYVSGDRETSYAQLADGAARVAGLLARHGVRPGDRVALALDGCVEYLEAYYGILLAGAVVVPLNPDTRPRVLAHALGHCEAAGVVIAGGALPHLAGAEGSLPSLRVAVSVGEARAELASTELRKIGDAAGVPPTEEVGGGEEALASINYTSGTTGMPKGVMLTHRNLVSNVRSIVAYLGLTPRDRVAMVLPYYYVYGNSVLHTHMAVGGTVVNTGTMTFPVRVLEEMAARRCTGLSGVPSTFAALLRAGDLRHFDLSSLRYLTQAGASMNRTLTAALRAALPQARVFVMYGQTEASARLSYLPPEDLERKAGSVGVAIPGVVLRVVDPDGRTLPVGSVGEIVAEGENVMLGYLGDAEATARALRGGVLHTADMGYMDEDGYLHIVGRRSEMIKSGGHRIGPHEIEDVVAAIPGVAECAVVGVADELLGEEIVAAVVLEEGTTLSEQALKRACFAELPRFKMPGRIVFLDELPRSDRGKVLRSVIRDRLEAGEGG